MNIIKFEIIGDFAEVSDEKFTKEARVHFVFPEQTAGYLSIGPRIIKVEGGRCEFSLELFADGLHGCYLMVGGERVEMPGLEKVGRFFRMVKSSRRSDIARVNYLKMLERRLDRLEEKMADAELKIYGKRSII